jgi:soluble lytic murein transglycosylase-like protein
MLSPYISDVPLNCVNQAASEYHVPAKLIIAILNVEGGKKGLASPNKNGTYDLGEMQINTSWWPRLYRYQVTPNAVLNDPCTNVKVGTWILATEIAESNNLIKGVGDYHSHTTMFNQPYAYQVRKNYTVLTNFLDK